MGIYSSRPHDNMARKGQSLDKAEYKCLHITVCIMKLSSLSFMMSHGISYLVFRFWLFGKMVTILAIFEDLVLLFDSSIDHI